MPALLKQQRYEAMNNQKKFTYFDIEGKQKEVTLDFSMMRTAESLTFILYVAKIVGGQIGDVLSSGNLNSLQQLKEKDFNYDSMVGEFFKIFSRVEEKEFIQKMDVLLSTVTHEGNVLSIDYHIFDGNVDLPFKVAAKVMEVNYRRFLRGISDKFLKLKDQVIRKLQSGIDSPPS